MKIKVGMKTCPYDCFQLLSITSCAHQNACMKKRVPIPEIAIVVRRRMPSSRDNYEDGDTVNS